MAAIAYPYSGPSGRRVPSQVRVRRAHLEVVGEGSRAGHLPSPRPSAHHYLLRRRVVAALLALGALLALWFGAGALAGAGRGGLARLPGSTPVAGGYAYVVRPGDTLWSIASRLDPNGDPRPIMDQLVAEVHGANLQPGTVLVVP